MLIFYLLLLGIMGGENYNHYAGGVNYLCLPNNPKYDKYKNGWQDSGYLYGTEYEVSQYNGDPFNVSMSMMHLALCASPIHVVEC